MAAIYILIFLITLLLALLFIFSRLKNEVDLSNTGTYEVLEVTISKNNADIKGDIQTAALAAENMFVALHGLLHEDKSKQEKLSFEVVFSGKGGIKFFVVVPSHILKFVEGQIYAQHPDASITVVEDYTKRIDIDNYVCQSTELSLSKPHFYPIKSFRDFETDPLSAFTSALSNIHDGEEFWFQIVLEPIADTWQDEGYSYVKAIREGLSWEKVHFFKIASSTIISEFFGLIGRVLTGLFENREIEEVRGSANKGNQVRLSPTQETEIRTIENKLSKVGYEANIRVFSCAESEERVKTNLRAFTASLKQYSGAGNNVFTTEGITTSKDSYKEFVERKFDGKKTLILSGEELATIYHFPDAHIETPNIVWAYSKKSEPPANLPTENCTYFADTIYRSKRIRFGLKNNDDRLRHMYVIGKSGVGKSTLFEVMASQDIRNGAGICMLDPHGETIEKVLEYIPEERIKDVVYIDPSDTERPIGLNLLELEDVSETNQMASGLLSAIKQHFDFSWGPRLEYLLNYALLTLVEIPGTTMLGITRLLEDKNYRNYIVHQVKDPVVKRFWEKEYKEMVGNQRFITEALSPIQNKVNRFLASSTIRNLLCQVRSTIDIWDIMQNNKILLINLSKGKIGQDNANLLGALLVSRIQFYALQRAKIRPEERTPFYLYVDEFQNFATGSFEEILSESRKYKLGLYLTHQYTAQLSEPLLKSVLGNVGTIITFSSGAMDARVMANEFAPFTAEDIITLQRFQAYTKLMIDGMTSLPFSARILTPFEEEYKDFLPQPTGNKEKILKHSREAYGTPKEYVEDKINKWINLNFDKGLAISETYRKGN